MTVPWTYCKFRNCWSCRTLKRKFCHLTKSSHWLHWKLSWWQFRQNDNISVSLNSICRCNDDQVPTTKLTHPPSTKWPPFTRRHFQMHFHEWKALYLIRISLKFVPNGPINNIPALIQIMARRQSGDKPLSQSMLTQFTDAYMRH